MAASILTVLGALVIPLVAFVLGGVMQNPTVQLAAMISAPASIVLAAFLARRGSEGEQRGSVWTWIVVAALSVLAAQNAHAVGSVVLGDGQPPADGEWPLFDLTQDEIPTPTQGYVEITGYLHDQWVLDEYRLEDGDRPNQNNEADFVLTPIIGTREAVIRSDDGSAYVVVARISCGELARIGSASRVTLKGKMDSIDSEVIGTLVTVDGGSAPTGALFDTQKTERQPLGMPLGLALIAAALALALGLFGTKPRADEPAHS